MCKAGKFEEFKLKAEPIIKKYFKSLEESGGEVNESNYMTWSLEFKSRNNKSIDRKEYLNFLYNLIDGRKNPVDIKNPDICVVIEIYKDVLMMGVIPKYRDLRKCNLQQLIKGDLEGAPDDSDEEG